MLKMVKTDNEEIDTNDATAAKVSDTVVVEAPSTEERSERAEEAIESKESTEVTTVSEEITKYDDDDDEHEYHMKVDEV